MLDRHTQERPAGPYVPFTPASGGRKFTASAVAGSNTCGAATGVVARGARRRREGIEVHGDAVAVDRIIHNLRRDGGAARRVHLDAVAAENQ